MCVCCTLLLIFFLFLNLLASMKMEWICMECRIGEDAKSKFDEEITRTEEDKDVLRSLDLS